MKKIWLFLILTSYSFNSYAYKEPRTGIVRQLIKEEQRIRNFDDNLLSRFNNRVIADFNLDGEYQSTDSQDQFKNSSLTNRLSSSFDITKNIAINGFFRFEQFDKATEITRRAAVNGGGDRSFEDHGLFIEELNISYENDKYSLILGKFNPNFATAWRWDRGIWSHEISENYRQVEKLGFQGIYSAGDSAKEGNYKFGYAIFKNDRKNLDNSLITKRDSNSKSDAIPGDDSLLQSYLLSLDVDFDFSEDENLSYHFSYLNSAVNANATSIDYSKINDQKSFSTAINYKYPINNHFNIDALVEYVAIKNYLGNSDVKERYLISNLVTKIYQNYNLTLGYSQRQNIIEQSLGFDQNLSEISMGYEFAKNNYFNHLLLQIGYKNERSDYKTSLESRNSFGILLRYQQDF